MARTIAFIIIFHWLEVEYSKYSTTQVDLLIQCNIIMCLVNLTLPCFSFVDTHCRVFLLLIQKYQFLTRGNSLILYKWHQCLTPKTETKECIFSWSYSSEQKQAIPAGGGFLENICTGMLKVDFRMLTVSIPVYCKKKNKTKQKQKQKQQNKKKKKKKKTPDHYTSLV